MRNWLIALLVVSSACALRAAVSVSQTAAYADADRNLAVVGGVVTLPADGFWWADEPAAASGLRQVYLRWSDEAMAAMRPGSQAPRPGEIEYLILAQRESSAKEGRVVVPLRNRRTGETIDCEWNLSSPAEADASLLNQWASARAMAWAGIARYTDSPILLHWLAVQEDLYEISLPMPGLERERPDRGEMADLFSVLGGRAAIRETLQLRQIEGAGEGQPELVPVSELKTVEVRSHPFEEMLKGTEGGRLALADVVPPDRGFAYFAKPSAVLPLLDQGVEFLYYGGTVAKESCVAYDVKEKYLARLGVTEAWLKAVLESGAVAELAVFVPDLFFIDGAEVTAVARVPSVKLLQPLLKLIGLAGLSGSAKAQPLKDGGEAWWALDGDLLVAGTSRGEVEKVLALRKAGGDGSLGRSAEFRYMLTKMPVGQATRMLAYLSDPFIRRLVGPEVKIGQVRRLKARAALEAAAAASLLYRVDGHPGAPDVAKLTALGYLPEDIAGEIQLRPNGVPESVEWGTAAQMKSLLAHPVARATPGEAQAYASYVDGYERFWRQYFDPIALRLDDAPGGRLEMTTFILPLIDNSVYNGIKQALQPSADGLPLRVPQLNPKPVMLFSLNLGPQVWGDQLKHFIMGAFDRAGFVDLRAFESLGPAVHLAVQDGDPILAFGSGDLLGAFGGNSMMFGRGEEMMFIPVAVSLLTRPCQLMIETRDPKGLLDVFRSIVTVVTAQGSRGGRGGPETTFYQVDGRDAWVCTIGFEGFVKIRFGIEIRGDYLVLNNLPWAPQPKIEGAPAEPLNAASLRVNPEAGVRQLPSLFTTAAERERGAALKGIGYLYPFLAAGAKTVDNAARMNAELFGFRVLHPGSGAWTWENGEVRSTLYGGLGDPRQPAYQPGDRGFGTFQGVSGITLNLQFEDDGLRVLSGWAWDRARGTAP